MEFMLTEQKCKPFYAQSGEYCFLRILGSSFLSIDYTVMHLEKAANYGKLRDFFQKISFRK